MTWTSPISGDDSGCMKLTNSSLLRPPSLFLSATSNRLLSFCSIFLVSSLSGSSISSAPYDSFWYSSHDTFPSLSVSFALTSSSIPSIKRLRKTAFTQLVSSSSETKPSLSVSKPLTRILKRFLASSGGRSSYSSFMSPRKASWSYSVPSFSDSFSSCGFGLSLPVVVAQTQLFTTSAQITKKRALSIFTDEQECRSFLWF